MEVLVSTESASGCLSIGHADVCWVAVLEAVAAECVLVVWVHVVNSAPLVAEVPHKHFVEVQPCEDCRWFGGEGDKDGRPGLVFLVVPMLSCL